MVNWTNEVNRGNWTKLRVFEGRIDNLEME